MVLVSRGYGFDAPLWAFLGLVGLAVCAEARPVRLTPTTEVSVSALPILFAAVTYGPLVAMAVGAAGLIADFRSPYARWLIWTAMRTLEAGLAGVAAMLVLGDNESLGHLIGAVATAALVEAHVDAGLAAITVKVRGRGSCREFLCSVRPVLLATVPVYTPFVVILVYAYREISPWSLVLFLVPAFAAHSFYKLYREQRQTTESLTQANARLERANLSFAAALVAALDARDQYTAGHSAAVALYTRDIAMELGMQGDDLGLAHLCGLVHDVGKVGLPPGILEKRGPLTFDQRRTMETHTIIGERILANAEDYTEIATIVRHHHERLDGGGYPDGLSGQEIPLLSRIIAVADAYDAMTSARPYRDAMPTPVAIERLVSGAGSHFDPVIVGAFARILSRPRPEATEMTRLLSQSRPPAFQEPPYGLARSA